MLHIDRLTPDTRALYLALRTAPDLADFRLIGGTAIGLHHAHRLSEDIDLVWCPHEGDGRRLTYLDTDAVGRVITQVRAAGLAIVPDDDPYLVEVAENEGANLRDSHQDWRSGSVRLTFFAPDDTARSGLFRSLETVEDGHVQLMSSDSLFELKSRLLVKRLTHRDLFDLWFFMDRLGKPLGQVIGLARKENPYWPEQAILDRLLSTNFASRDPGVESLLEDGPTDAMDLSLRLREIVGRKAETGMAP